MNLKQFAEMLNGRQYLLEIAKEEIRLAKELGFVVVYGVSDDLTEFEGAINDEVACCNGGKIYLDEIGILEECVHECRYYKVAKEKAKIIEAEWAKDGYSWQYKTNIPHETFEIFEDGEKYCKGIVFDVKSLE